ncbi:replication-relaxation family protein, partial [Streptomyces cadmiisoli]|uniref:replication-relaxation family protein n=1 Tax=Streptomyces cadmiisoli TaxID=2184053 RepID=UPI00365D908B
YRMATTEQMHLVVAPGVRIEQTRRRLAKLRGEGLVDRVTLPRAGRSRVWFVTRYGAQVVSEWPELRGWRPSRLVGDRTAARLRVGHALTVTETGIAFLQDARRRGEVCRPLDWIPEVHHSLGSGEAVIPGALLFYRRGREHGEGGVMLRAFVEVERATMGPERLAAKVAAYARLLTYTPVPVARPGQPSSRSLRWRTGGAATRSSRGCCFVLDGTGPAGIDNRITALHAATRQPALAGFLRDIPSFIAIGGCLASFGSSRSSISVSTTQGEAPRPGS